MSATPMSRQVLCVVLSAILPFLDAGCTVNKVRKIDVNKAPQGPGARIVGLTTKAGEEIAFDPPGGEIIQDTIHGNVKNIPYSIAVQDTQRLWIEQRGVSAARTIGLAVGIAAGAFAALLVIVALTKQSCPFVYSWDGTHYVFDAEPYGGAITRGLERDDYSELEHLREQNGQYRLLITNEVDETQFTNLMELLVVDHAPGLRAVSDEDGNLRGFAEIQPLLAASDLYGRDLLAWLKSTDRKIWEPEPMAGPDGRLQQEVTLTFPKPEGAAQANVIVNAATGLWGSYMIKRIVELHGRDSAAWLASMDRDQEAIKSVHAWGEREGTYRLRIEVEEPSGWTVRGTVPPGGPLLAEDRVIALDVSRVRGSQLRLRLRPPVGFWAFNSFAVAYAEGQAVSVTHVAPKLARASDGRDVAADLTKVDDRYYAMPSNADRAEITFPAPLRKAGLDRTVFLHSRGWYELHLRDHADPDIATFIRIMTTPGVAAQFAADRYAEWRQSATR